MQTSEKITEEQRKQEATAPHRFYSRMSWGMAAVTFSTILQLISDQTIAQKHSTAFSVVFFVMPLWICAALVLEFLAAYYAFDDSGVTHIKAIYFPSLLFIITIPALATLFGGFSGFYAIAFIAGVVASGYLTFYFYRARCTESDDEVTAEYRRTGKMPTEAFTGIEIKRYTSEPYP